MLRRGVIGSVAFLLTTALAGCGGSSVDARIAVAADAAVDGHRTTPTTGPAQQVAAVVPGAPTTGVAVPNDSAQPPLATSGGGIVTQTNADGGSNAGGGHSSSTGGNAAACTGFHNQTGITDRAVTIATVADVSGPVPGIFTSAQEAVKAYAAYFNATSSLCGRKLAVLPLDSKTDSVGDQAAYLTACDKSFAAVGSMSAFDDGGAADTQKCGLPDLRAMAVADSRNACTTCYGAQATAEHVFQNAVADFFLAHYPDASKHAATLYVDAAASVQTAKYQQAAEEQRGMKFVYASSFDVAEFNYGPYVQKMKEKGVRWVQFIGSSDEAVRLARAMQQGSFKPDVFLLDPTAYDPLFTQAGSAVDGSIIFIDFTPFEEASSNSELRLYEQWLHEVAPSSSPSYFGLFAWSAARLFVEQASALGGRLSRSTLLDGVRQVHVWTSNGLHAPQDVGGKVNGSCWRFLQLHGGRWRPLDGTSYLCHGSTRIG